MFGIEKDFQKLMEQVYGPLGKKEEEECDRMAKQLVDNAVEEVKKMTETHDLRNQWYDEPVRYETPMTENEEEIEKVKAQIKVLEKKLSFLEELEKTKTPVEEAFKRVYGYYPVSDDTDGCWENFQAGYKSAQKDYKVGEYQEPEEEPEELKTLYQMFCDKYWPKPNCDVFCDIVKEWMSQYTHNVMSGEYLKGYEECLTVLEENLK